MTMPRKKNPAAVALGRMTSPRKALTSAANGRGRQPTYRVLDGHPVTYSLTLQRRGGDTWQTPARLSLQSLAYVTRWLREHKPLMQLTRIEGGYVYYDPA